MKHSKFSKYYYLEMDLPGVMLRENTDTTLFYLGDLKVIVTKSYYDKLTGEIIVEEF